MDPSITPYPMASATLIDTDTMGNGNINNEDNMTMAAPAAAPMALRPTLSKGRSSRVNLPYQKSYRLQETEISYLLQQGFTRGLASTLTQNNAVFPLRFWVIDNSGSMRIADGHRLVESSNKNDVKLVDCTRWSEIQQTVEYHAQMAALVKAPTVFRLLNDPGKVVGPQQFSIGERNANANANANSNNNDNDNDTDQLLDEDLAVAMSCIRNASPGGVTPLSEHVREIRSNILSMESALRREGTKVAIIIATDGLPTDAQGRCDASTKREFTETLRSLQGLPVWIVIRLCTDEDDVVQFYNDIDEQLELSIEVLDDFTQEATEVYQKNPWINYTLPLHRCREMGYHNPLFDLLDERLLSPDELRDFLFLIFGAENFDGVPDPQADWKGFMKSISVIAKKEKPQWNPIKKKLMPWVDLNKLEKLYGKKGCTIM